MIDWDRVVELQTEIGPEDFGEIVELFLEEVDETVDALPSQPADALKADFHFLTGSALNLGFADFAKLCAAGERASQTGSYDLAQLPDVVECYRNSRAEFLANLDQTLAA